MKKIVMVLAIFALAIVPAGSVFAVSGSDSTKEVETEKTETKSTEVENETENETEPHVQELTSEQKAKAEAAKKAAEARSEQAKKDAEARRITVKKDRCEESKGKLTEAVPHLAQGVTSVKKALDEKYQKVQDIYSSGKLTVSNYETLNTNVNSAKAAAEASIANIDPASVTIDCANGALGTQLDSYRSTVKEARTSLKQYHTALVVLIEGLTSAADATTTEGTTNAQ